MDNLLIILVVVLIFFILVLITVFTYLGLRFLKMRELELKNRLVQHHSESTKEAHTHHALRTKDQIKPELLESLRARAQEKKPSLYCVDHPEEIAKGVCAISNDSFCEHCLTKQGDVKIAKKFLDLYVDSEWVEVIMIPNDEGNQDLKERILKVKTSLWQEKNLPMIVQGHYKINVQDDQIEEYTVIFSRSNDLAIVKKELSFVQY